MPIEAFVGIADFIVVASSVSSTSSVCVLKAAAAGTMNNQHHKNHDDETDTVTPVSQKAVGRETGTELASVRNLRPLYAGSNLYRAATFDDLTDDDTARLFDGSAFAASAATSTPTHQVQNKNNNNNNTREELVAVIDLRNTDEIQKGVQKRTHGSREFYTTTTTTSSSRHNATSRRRPIRFVSVPILQNVNRFWDATIATMEGRTQALGWFQTIFVGGALDRLAARHLEKGGLALLYQIMLQTAGDQLLRALTTILQILEEDEETQKKQQRQQQQQGSTDDDSSTYNNNTRRRPIIIFHCQKGKDRTGILAMLLQSILCEGNERGTIDKDIIESYAVSGNLLNEFPNTSNNNDDEQQQQQQASSSTIDWSYFRGSPAEAMRDTLQWIRQEYGSVNQYLDRISFDHEKRARLRHYCGVVAKIDDGARASENNKE